MMKQLLGAVVGGLAAWIVGFVVFGVVYPMVFSEPPSEPAMSEMLGIYLVGAVSLFLIAQAMATIGGGVNRQMTKLLWFVGGALVYPRIGDAVWMPSEYAMGPAVFTTVGELLCLAVGGYVMARWFLNAAPAAAAPAE